MTIQIDSHIPLPSTVSFRTSYPWKQLEIGQSFLVTVRWPSLAAYARKIGAKYNREFVVARVEGGKRVWRTR